MAICGNDLGHPLQQEAKNSHAWLHTLTVWRWHTEGEGNDDRKKAFCTLIHHVLTECARVHHALNYAVGFTLFVFPPDLSLPEINQGLTLDLFTASVECRLC